MLVRLLKSKLHCARVTSAKLHYQGSMAVDSDLMDAVGLAPHECVLVADVDNGSRLETYVVPAEPGSKKIEILGAAARLIEVGHTVIVMSFGFVEAAEAGDHKPKVLVLDENNDVVQTP